MRARPKTDLYMDKVRRALDRPGTWIDVRVFDTKFNADISARCLAGGYLRVQPRKGDKPYRGPRGQNWPATPGPVDTQVVEQSDGWLVRIRAAA